MAGAGSASQLGENYPGGGAGHTGFTGTYLHVNEGSGLVIVLLTSRLHEPRPRDINPIRREFSRSGAFALRLEAAGPPHHLKTAGTTWLEELIGLAASGGEGLRIAKEIYGAALQRFDELCAPYASVIDVRRASLPTAESVADWSGAAFADTLRHDPACPAYNADFRQLLHGQLQTGGRDGRAVY